MSKNNPVPDQNTPSVKYPQVHFFPATHKVNLFSFNNGLKRLETEKVDGQRDRIFSSNTPPPSPDQMLSPRERTTLFSEDPTPEKFRPEPTSKNMPIYPHFSAPRAPQQSYAGPYISINTHQGPQNNSPHPYMYMMPNFQMPPMMYPCNGTCGMNYFYYNNHFRNLQQRTPLNFMAGEQQMEGQISKNLNSTELQPESAREETPHREKPFVSFTAVSHTPAMVDTLKLKKLFYQYFFEYPKQTFFPSITPEEFKITQLILIKKLVHDKRKSRVYKLIVNLPIDRLMEFLRVNKPVTRKNITKSCIFTKIWQVLGLKHGEAFYEYYFEDLVNNKNSLIYLYKHQQILKNKLWDSFYAECFLSDRFKTDFLHILEDPRFKNEVIQASQRKFNKNFASWITKLEDFIANVEQPIDVNVRIPEFKPGITEADFDLCPGLFQRIIQKIEPKNLIN